MKINRIWIWITVMILWTAGLSFGSVSLYFEEIEKADSFQTHSLAGNSDKLLQVEIRKNPEFKLVSSELTAKVAQEEEILLSGTEGLIRKIRLSGLSGADYYLRINAEIKEDRILVDAQMIDVLTGIAQWEDSVYTADLKTEEGLKAAFRNLTERLLRKMSGQSVGKYIELSAGEAQGIYQVKVDIGRIRHKKRGADYRIELMPYGIVQENESVIVEGNQDYQVLVIQEDGNEEKQVYSNQIYIDEKRKISLVDSEWGKLLNFSIFTGMGMIGAGLDLYLTRYLYTGIHGSFSYFNRFEAQGIQPYLSFAFLPELHYLWMGDSTDSFRSGIGIAGHYHNSGRFSDLSFNQPGFGAGPMISFEYGMAFVKLGLTLSLYETEVSSTNMGGGIYPVFKAGVRF